MLHRRYYKEGSMTKMWAKHLNVHETSVITQAESLHRRLLMLPPCTNFKLNDDDRCIICLDIAAELLCFNFDWKEAIKRSALNKLQYIRDKRNIFTLLSIKKTYSCAGICNQLHLCNQKVQKQAEFLLDNYRRSLNYEIDLSHPQYACMAVFLSCHLQKVKINMNEIVLKSTLRKTQWSLLRKQWEKRMEESAILNDQPVAVDEKTAVFTSQKEKNEEPAVTESYEDWKERMLQKAYAELKELQKLEELKKQGL